jgi:hypothetical protein
MNIGIGRGIEEKRRRNREGEEKSIGKEEGRKGIRREERRG